MDEQRPSKDLCSELRGLNAGARLLGYTAAEHIERLETALRGIQSCSTCEACRGAATLALGETPQPPSPIPFAGVAKGVSYEALANATYPERMYGGDTTPEPEPTHFAFLIKRPRDKEAWPTIFDSRERAEGYEHRASPVVPVRLAQPPGDEQ